MRDDDNEFEALDTLIRAYLHQDMEIDADTMPEAISNVSRLEGDAYKNALRSAMDRFEHRHHNRLEEAFAERYWFDFVPDGPDESVPKFFDMVRAILDDPESYRRFEDPPVR